MKHSKLIGRIALFLLVAASASDLLLRGVLRITARGADLASPYVSAQRLIKGKNPYSPADFLRDWHTGGAPVKMTLDPSARHPIYPPTALVLVSPLATIPWPVSIRIYGWGCTFAYVVLVWLLAGNVRTSWTSARRLGFVAFAFGLSPVQAGISLGNLSALVFLLCGYGLFLAWRRYQIAAGVLLGLGLCIKPTSAIAAIALVLLYGRTKAFLTAVGLSAAIAACSAIVFSHLDPIWKVDYFNNIGMLFGPTGAANFAMAGGNFDLVNLQMPIYILCANARIANALAVAFALGLGVAWLYLFLRERRMGADWDWLGVSSLLMIALLPVYQRNYNAGPILFAAMWAFGNLRIRDAGAKVAALIGFIFLVPGQGLLRNMRLGPEFWSSVLWKTLVMPQLTWAILAAIAACYFYRLRCIRLDEKLQIRTADTLPSQ